MSDRPVCSCDGPPFIYQPDGRIVTGDVSIVGSNVLEDLLTKGPKYREPRSFSWSTNFKSIMNAVEDYIIGSGLKRKVLVTVCSFLVGLV